MNKLLAFVATLILGAAVLPATASAHTPDVSSTCSELTVKLTAYEGPADNNTVTVTIDGVTETFMFGRSFEQTFPIDPTTQSYWTVVVDANINQGDPARYDRVFEGSEYPCPTATTSSPSTTTPPTAPSSTSPSSTSTTTPAPTTTVPATTATSTTTTTSSSPPSTSPTSVPTSPPSSAPASSAPSSTTSVPDTSGPTTSEPGLPVTGSTTQTTAGAALITLAAGALLVLIARRRSVA